MSSIEIRCKKCGDPLGDIVVDQINMGELIVKIEPCENCIDNATFIEERYFEGLLKEKIQQAKELKEKLESFITNFDRE